MKKIITLLFVCLLITKVFAGPSFWSGWINYTQSTGGSAFNTFHFNIPANVGDHLRLYVYEDCGTGIPEFPQDWKFNGAILANALDSLEINVIVPQSGTYAAYMNICIFGGSGMGNMEFQVINVNTGIPSFKNINSLNVFPTAVTSSITIQLNSIKTNDIEISFFDMNGNQLKNDFYKNIVGEFIKNENTEALSKGIYFLRIKEGEDVVEKKFVKM